MTKTQRHIIYWIQLLVGWIIISQIVNANFFSWRWQGTVVAVFLVTFAREWL